MPFTGAPSGDGRLRLLVVCTANQCRSPLGEVIARHRLAERGIDAVVGSAGTSAIEDSPATDGAIAAAKSRGLDLTSHRSRPVTSELVVGADLVVCMEPAHVVDVVDDHDGVLASTFTLPELARATAAHPPRDPAESLADWLARIGAGRTPIAVLAAPRIDDPIGRSNRRYRATAAMIDEMLTQVFDHLSGPGGAP